MASSSSRTVRENTGGTTADPRNAGPDSDDDDGDDGDDDNRSSSDEESDWRLEILQIVSVFHPNYLSPQEFISNGRGTSNGDQLTRRLASALVQLVRSDDDLRILREAIPIAGPLWTEQLVTNMERRFRTIEDGLLRNISNMRDGQDVVGTISMLRTLFTAMDGIRASYFPRVSAGSRNAFASLMVSMMTWMLRSNGDRYAATPRPASAGSTIHGENRLISCFLSAQSQPQLFIGVVNRFDGHLQHEALRLRQLFERVDGHFRAGLEGDSDEVHRQTLWQLRLHLERLAQNARA
ncbi:hypothetical protein LTR62_000629 [Meristemomyces frigidus]|uniref:Uncharacterized protein n=1 Tax=Meristemomyces frigidus TaxID=1508187 RepID=A0AAN7YC99_9PEZI|nr:hypothetical protein LTR62_000629 [Meristemomyces frigidus]